MAGQSKKSRWEHFPHKADIGIRGKGPTMEEAFAQAAVALTVVITEPEKVQPEQKVQINCEAPDYELLFVDWLNGIIYEMATRQMLFSRFEVSIKDCHLNGTAWGEKTDVARHSPAVEVKAATYTALSVHQDENKIWTAQCVVDV